MIFHSIRWRLQSWHGLILVLVLTAFGFSAYRVARDNQIRRVDQELDYRMGGLLFRPPPERPREGPRDRPPGPPHEEGRGPRGFDFADFIQRLTERVEQAGVADPSQTNNFYYVLWQNASLKAKSPNAPKDVPFPEDSEPLQGRETKDLKASLAGPKPPPEPRARDGVREMFRTFPHGECVLVGHVMAAEHAAMRRLALWLGLAGLAVSILGWAGGWWVSTQAMRPIEDISATATRIAAGDLSQRINVADTDNELGKLAALLNSTFARLEAAFANQARFTADASHELRTPLAVILSQAQTALSRERGPAEYREALEACQRAAQRMRHLAESLLDLAKLDAGQAQFRHEPFDLSHVARESLELVRPLATERGINVECELTSVPCVGDPQRISQVTTNLLSNAIQFNRQNGKIRVSAYRENENAVLTVSDTGPGIPAEDLPHIFERFYRVEKSRSRVQGRTGLGLAITKAIVNAHGGSIAVSSDPATGTTFTVKLRLP